MIIAISVGCLNAGWRIAIDVTVQAHGSAAFFLSGRKTIERCATIPEVMEG
jgi:hypothetical protein